MKATGIVRRIDELGRIVVPKEIRRTLRIREGDPLEVYTDREGEIILKKYSPVGELANFAAQYAKVLAETTGKLVCITDMDHVIAAAGNGKKAYENQPITGELESLIAGRQDYHAKKQRMSSHWLTKPRRNMPSRRLPLSMCTGISWVPLSFWGRMRFLPWRSLWYARLPNFWAVLWKIRTDI